MKLTTFSERVLVLAPRGRDGAIAVAMLGEAKVQAEACPTVPLLVEQLDQGAAVVVVTEEALQNADVAALAKWIAEQEPWSDLPFVLLTSHGGGIERNPAAGRYLEMLSNATFIERPFHPTTLVSLVRAALRGRQRQYEARTRLDALRANEERLQFALQAGAMGAWELELDSFQLTASDNCRINFGFAPGSDFSYDCLRSVIHPEDRERMEAAVHRSIADRHDYDIEYRVIWPGTTETHWVAIRGRPIYANDGTPVRMAGVSYDVTQRKLAADALHESERQLREFNETLERRVESEVSERNKAEDALRQAQKMEAVGQLTGGVAHDFNNLLTIIKSSTDLLRRNEISEERRGRYVEAISDTVDRAAKLTGQLLAFARRQSLKPEVFDVVAQLSSIGDMLKTLAGSRIPIETRVQSENVYVEADVIQFETALVNMAVNARDAMNGEGSLEIAVRELPSIPSSQGATKASKAFVAVSVKDTGTGIPKDKISLIFEPFFTTKEVGKGTGLGLSQVYGFAKQSGGDVGVESEIGRGTTITLYLPRVLQAAKTALQALPIEIDLPRAGSGKRVLVVEDNVEVGQFSTQILQDLGYETTWAENGDEALKLLEEPDRFDVVFSDVIMPGIGGVELGLEIRRRLPDMPIILVSGYSPVLAEEGRHGFELLQKPYAAEELSRVLRRLTSSKMPAAR